MQRLLEPSTFALNLGAVETLSIFENEFIGLEKTNYQWVAAAIQLLYRPLLTLHLRLS